jgi:hypothetical protein
VTQRATDLDAYMGVLNNPRAMPLLLALTGPCLHIMEAGARTVALAAGRRAMQAPLLIFHS